MPLAEWVLTAYLGGAHTMHAPLVVVQREAGTEITVEDVNYRGESFTPPLYYGYRLSRFARPDAGLGFEAEFIHLKVYARTDVQARVVGTHRNAAADGTINLRNIIDRFSMSHGLNLIFVNGVIRRTLGNRRSTHCLALTARAGAGPTVPHAESTIDGISREGYEFGGLAVQASGGIEIGITHTLSAVADYKFTSTAQRVSLDRGYAEGRFHSHHGVVGIAWHRR